MSRSWLAALAPLLLACGQDCYDALCPAGLVVLLEPTLPTYGSYTFEVIADAETLTCTATSTVPLRGCNSGEDIALKLEKVDAGAYEIQAFVLTGRFPAHVSVRVLRSVEPGTELEVRTGSGDPVYQMEKSSGPSCPQQCKTGRLTL